ncbi:MAG TPA: TonB-dependent receptor [Nitrospiria bacterium]|nr:TonB-dependent receptor [Nitrospiria bacterium]
MRALAIALSIFLEIGLSFSVRAQDLNMDQNQKKEGETREAGQVRGVVKDSIGKPLAGAALRLQSADGQVVGRTQSDPDGQFTFTNVAPGTYAVVGEKTGFEPATAIVSLSAGEEAGTSLTLAASQALDLHVVAERLERARNGLLPETGSSIYRFDQKDIAVLPEGEQTPVNQVLLQAPGVAQDSYGQLHVRGEHANVQYRINGVILPEGITGFGQAFDTRFADRFNFLTGALPAEYGYRTAGVVDIETKQEAFANGGRVDLYGGSHDHLEPSAEFGGSGGPLNYYLTGSYLQNDLGIESPTSDANPLHDKTQQGKGFGYFSYLLNSTSRLSLILGNAQGTFQIPNNPGQTPGFTLNGTSRFDSADLNENQREVNRYGVLALQGTAGSRFDYQIAAFSRDSQVLFRPDPVGDLIFNGVASRVERTSFANGLQEDSSYRLNGAHTLRAGFLASGERAVSDNTSAVFPTDINGNPVGDQPVTIVDNNSKTAWLYGLYLQDEWRPLDELTVNYGVRADWVDAYVQGNQVSPRFGLVYQPISGTTLHAGYARYFTPPPTELVAPKDLALFQNTTNAASCVPNAPCNSNVLPEHSHYFDLGGIQQLTSSLSLGLDAYYKIVQDLLDEGQFGQALVFSPFNYRNGKIYGVEFTSNYKKDNFSGYLNAAYSKAMGKDIVSAQFNFDDPAEFDYIANHYIHLDHDQTYTSSAGVSYRWLETDYNVDALYGSGLRRGFANTGKLPYNLQVNLGLTHGVAVSRRGKVEVRLAVLNLFDRVNELRDGSGVGVGAPQFATRRSFYGGINYAF